MEILCNTDTPAASLPDISPNQYTFIYLLPQILYMVFYYYFPLLLTSWTTYIRAITKVLKKRSKLEHMINDLMSR